MALLFVDGFDHTGNAGDISASGSGKWGLKTFSVTAPSTAVSVKRTGAASLYMPGSSTLTTKIYATSGGAVVGFAFNNSHTTWSLDLCQVLEGAVVHVAIGTTAALNLTVKRGTTVLATGTTVLALNTWYSIELKTVIHDTAGSYELRIDGVLELSASGVDTRNAGTGVWDRVRVQSPSVAGGTEVFLDDFYLCDTSGAAPLNTFLGAVKIDTLLPQTDAVSGGSNAGLTCSTGTDHGALVDEVPPNTTDFTSAATVGLKDTYQYPSGTLTGTLLGVQTTLYVNKADAVARQVCAVVRAGGTDYDGANVAPTTTFAYVTEVRPLNPNTGVAWTASDITAIQVGMKITA